MKRIPELDSLRGIAAVAILVYHFAPGWLPLGWSAVDFFFVLSGYLITVILLENRGSPRAFRTFYIRRSLRIWPIYYLVLLALSGFVWLLGSRAPASYSLQGFPYYALYLQNIELYWGARPTPFLPPFSHTWTLAVEEQFYLLWPLAVYLIGPRLLPYACGAVLAASVAARMVTFDGTLLLARSDGFALGGLLASLHFLKAGQARRITALVAGAAAAALLVVQGMGRDASLHMTRGETLILAMSLAYYVVLGLILDRTGGTALAALRARPLVYLGAISYGLYLYHVPVLHAVEFGFRALGQYHTFGPERPLWRGAIEFALTLGIAALSWRYIEQPILSLKDRFQYR